MNFFKKLMGYALVGCLTVSVCAQAEQNYVASESDKSVVIRSTIAVGAAMAGGATLCFKADGHEHPYLMTASGLAVFGVACCLAPLILKELKKVFSKNNDEKITRSDKERWKL